MLKPLLRYSLIFLLLTSASVAFQRLDSGIGSKLLQKGIDHGFPGFILAMQKSSEDADIKSDGFSDLKIKVPMNPADRFHIASVTKLFTAIATLKLIDAGKLSLKTKVVDVLDKSIVKNIPYIDQVTVSHLLDHSSGIYSFNNDPGYIDVWLGSKYDPKKMWSAGELLAFANGERNKPNGKPGTGTHYGDNNYVLLQLVIEKKTGTTLRKLVKKTILDPLKLKDTGYFGMTDNADRIELRPTVRGYLKRSEIIDSIVKLDSSYKNATDSLIDTTVAVERIDASSGMVSTARDLAVFGRALYSGKLLKKQTMNWLLSIGDGFESRKPGTSKQGVMKVHRESYGVLFASTGDGPAGINVTLAYHPASDQVIVGFTNIFGLFDEADFMREQIFGGLVGQGRAKE